MTNDEDIIRPHLPHAADRGLSAEQKRQNRKILREHEEAERVRVEMLEQQHKAEIKRLSSPNPPADGGRYGRTWASLND